MDLHRLHFFPLLITLFVAGCFGAGPEPPKPEDLGAPSATPVPGLVDIPAGTLPSGCDGSRPAIVYTPSNASVQAPSDLSPVVPCSLPWIRPTWEPTIGIASTGAVIVAPATQQWQVGDAHLLDWGFLRSVDEGRTWEFKFPELANGRSVHQYSNDPFMYLDPSTDRIWLENLHTPCGLISHTDDLGETWEHSMAGCTVTDHVTIFAGPPTTSTTTDYPNVVYRCGYALVATSQASTTSACQKSTDGGRLWVHTGEPVFITGFSGGATSQRGGPCSMGLGHGVADLQGTIYLPKGHCGQPWLAISQDEGATWARVQVSDLGVSTDVGGNICYGVGCEHVGPAENHDAAVGVDRDGTIYYAWVAADRLAYLATSHDGGATWSKPVRVTDPSINEVVFVELAVGAPGRVALAIVGTEDGPGAPFPDPYLSGAYDSTTWNGYIIVAMDATSEAPTFHRGAINPPGDPLVQGFCWGSCGVNMGDFIDIRIGPDGTPWVPFGDDCVEANCDNPPGILLVGRLVGVDLWDDVDPNGPYPGP